MSSSTEKQKAIIHYIIKAKNGCSITELMKLAYLLDIGFKKVTGKVLSDFKFERYYYGPFTSEIYDIANNFRAQDIIYLTESLAVDGKSIFNIHKSVSYDCLDNDEIELINQLLQEVLNMSATQLTTLSYKTEPMVALGATLGGDENLHEPLTLQQ